MTNGDTTSKPTVAWTIDVSTVLAILGLIGSGIFFVTQTRSDTTNIKEQLTEIKTIIAGIPASAAHVIEIDRRLTELDQWKAGAERRDTEQRDDINKLRATVESLERTVNTRSQGR